MRDRAPKLFVGVGCVLHRDDGVGVRAAEVLDSLDLPGDIEVYDAGSVGLDAAPTLEGRDLVVIVDALDAGLDPGTIVRTTPDDLAPLIRTGLSIHDLHLLDAIQDANLRRPPKRIVVFVVQVGDVSMGLGLTPAVEDAMNTVLRHALTEFGVYEGLLTDTPRTSVWCAGVERQHTEDMPCKST